MIAALLYIVIELRSSDRTTTAPTLFGPQSTIVSDDAFAPARAWQPGLSADDRTRLLVGGAIFSLAAIGCTLLRSRRAKLLGLTGVTIAAAIGIGVLERSLATLQRIGGDVIIVRADPADASTMIIAQVDRWQFFATRSSTPTIVQFPIAPNAVRVSCDAFPITRDNLTIGSESAGSDQSLFAWLARGDRIATLTRSAIQPGQPPTIFDMRKLNGDVPRAMIRLAKSEYAPLPVIGSVTDGGSTTVVLRGN